MIFEIRNNKAFPTTFALLKEPYKSIWEEDTSPDKDTAIKFFSYLEFMCNPRKSNPFFSYKDDERIKKVCKEVFKDENFIVPSELVLATIAFKDDLEHASSGYSALVDAENALHKMRKFLNDLDPAKTTPNGTLLLKPKDVILAAKEMPGLVDRLRLAREKVNQELDESAVKTRNQRQPNRWEE